MTVVSEALTERMIALVRNMDRHATQCWGGDYETARAIVAELPAPVDPDLIEARKVVAQMCHDRDWAGVWASNVCEGKHDAHESVVCALAALKRGRELAEQSK